MEGGKGGKKESFHAQPLSASRLSGVPCQAVERLFFYPSLCAHLFLSGSLTLSFLPFPIISLIVALSF